MHVLTASCYHGSALGDSLFGYTSSLTPQCGYDNFSKVIPLVVSAIMADAGLENELKPEQIVSAMPSNKKLQSATERHAVETMLLIQNSIAANSNIFIAIGKGNTKCNKTLSKQCRDSGGGGTKFSLATE
eukprot:7903728-Ditylum_brightwellii.AAC.1